MLELLTLPQLGPRFKTIDRQIIGLLSQRMQLSKQVEKIKEKEGQPILRPEIEEKRLNEVAEWASGSGMSPNFAKSLFYFIIKESCSVQIGLLQNEQHEVVPPSDTEWHEMLKQDLLDLTSAIAITYDEMYDKAFFATHSYLDFERDVLNGMLDSMDEKGLALDIGCATGNISIRMAPLFGKVLGYDISPAMIAQANAKLTPGGIQNVGFEVADIENGITLPDASVSLVVMNFGTASDIYNIEALLSETKRVLTSEGRFFFSFYNAEALFYKWFIPWQISLAAEINLQKHCLDVHHKDEVYSIYAHPYTVAGVKKLLSEKFSIDSITTYPTVSSILPNELLEEDIVRESMTEIDHALSELNLGAYILATGGKQ